MESAANHLSREALEQGLQEVRDSPVDDGRLEAVFVRPETNERKALATVQLSPEGGIEGDRWATDHWQKLPDGRPDPASQVSLMNARILRLIAGEADAMSLAGDNLIVNLDLSDENLPVGSRLEIGSTVLLEITAQPHTGCRKFAHRFGSDALGLVNSPLGKQLNLRGRYAQVIQGGTIQVGDRVKKI